MYSKKSEKITETKYTNKEPKKNNMGHPAYPNKLLKATQSTKAKRVKIA